MALTPDKGRKTLSTGTSAKNLPSICEESPDQSDVPKGFVRVKITNFARTTKLEPIEQIIPVRLFVQKTNREPRISGTAEPPRDGRPKKAGWIGRTWRKITRRR